MIGLFLDTPEQLQRRIDRVVEHFRHAAYVYRETGKGKASAATREQLLEILLREAFQADRGDPDQEKAWLRGGGGSLFNSIRVSEADAWDIELSRRLDQRFRGTNLEFKTPYEPNRPDRSVSREVAQRKEDILDLLRFLRNEGRDARINVLKAKFYGLSTDQCARVWNRHQVYEGPRHRWRVVYEQTHKAYREIFIGMEQEFRLRFTGRGLERIVEREIEARAKARKRREAEENAG